MTAALCVVLSKRFLDGDVMGSEVSSAYAMQGATLEPACAMRAGIDTTIVANAFAAAKTWMDQHFALFTLMSLPVEALGFKWAFRRFREINYPEWLVIVSFLTTQTFVLWSLSAPLQRMWPGIRQWSFLVAVGYNLFSLVRCFRDYPRWKSLLRGLLGFAYFNLAIALVTVAAIIVLMVMAMR
ncbi:hypothetical protein EBB59_12550 [Lysobacter pythonis]|uniref:Uncharacterized protein n=1 Tax=Solilutibacter pythonis TaxID=2483112 RepID=A0A3M2HK35_9GAMM|nr:hypothetical protein [Lysobacter pythonis]RMH87749.1 hypothetical protein EBB59_12550 [Lysobacter pythonis]